MRLADELRLVDRHGRLDDHATVVALERQGFIWDDDEAGIYRLTLAGRKVLDGPGPPA